MIQLTHFLKTALLAAVCALTALAHAQAPIKAVYHLSEGIEQSSNAMFNIRNHLDADPTAKIVVVTNNAGIDFLLEGAKTTSGASFAGAVGDLASKGVEFRICKNTLVARNIDASKVALEATVVPSGVAEVARLQAREGFVYLKP